MLPKPSEDYCTGQLNQEVLLDPPATTQVSPEPKSSEHSYPPLFLLTGCSKHFTNIAASSPLLRREVPSREQNTTLWNKYWTII